MLRVSFPSHAYATAIASIPYHARTHPCLFHEIDVYGGLIVDDLIKAGEFSIDLYTMPDGLTSKLWDHLVSLF